MIQLLGDSIEREKARFKPDTTRFMMDVTIKSFNKKMNKQVSESGTFYFDKDITQIVGALSPQDGTLVYIEYGQHQPSPKP